jgi:hypothetical protein
MPPRSGKYTNRRARPDRPDVIWPAEVRAELARRAAMWLAMREPRCTCGHVLTKHTRRRLLCYLRGPLWGRPGCGCKGWTPEPRQAPE